MSPLHLTPLLFPIYLKFLPDPNNHVSYRIPGLASALALDPRPTPDFNFSYSIWHIAHSNCATESRYGKKKFETLKD